jgi:Sister chromatid cohesion protein Dcc1
MNCFAIQTLDRNKNNHTYKTTVKNYKKVAVCIVRQLFLKQSTPWNEGDLLRVWQSELPGVGDVYQVSCTMLHGVAIWTKTNVVVIPNTTTSEQRRMTANGIDSVKHTNHPSPPQPERVWHYLPVESMSTNPQICLDRLYTYKDRYTMYELEPYLHHLLDALPSNSGSNGTISSIELLLRYTKAATDIDDNGVSRTFYQKK